MSVFGPRDKDVPLLTQLYQLDIAGPDDPDTFHKAAYYHSDLDKWLGQNEGHGFWSDDKEYLSPTQFFMEQDAADIARLTEAGEVTPEILKEAALRKQWHIEQDAASHKSSASSDIRSRYFHLINIIALVKRILTSGCDTENLDEEDVKFLFEQSKLYRPVPHYEWKTNERGSILLSSLEISDFSPSLNGMEWQVLRAMETALNKARRVPGYFQRCQQCHNVFLRERGQAIYCSRRCNVRAQTRRWRERESSKQ